MDKKKPKQTAKAKVLKKKVTKTVSDKKKVNKNASPKKGGLRRV